MLVFGGVVHVVRLLLLKLLLLLLRERVLLLLSPQHGHQQLRGGRRSSATRFVLFIVRRESLIQPSSSPIPLLRSGGGGGVTRSPGGLSGSLVIAGVGVGSVRFGVIPPPLLRKRRSGRRRSSGRVGLSVKSFASGLLVEPVFAFRTKTDTSSTLGTFLVTGVMGFLAGKTSTSHLLVGVRARAVGGATGGSEVGGFVGLFLGHGRR